ncbi:hypothetical protein CEP54_013392 [Fusarium duplospermum]|uniref:Uncharacterized protein n=1 Tax=Fusarium duplospermum TaxID=1325734 RepID=A0A428P366_9HYPO|nr:hypothetical protein CEP54_013392 [Fusarium duplospermum]
MGGIFGSAIGLTQVESLIANGEDVNEVANDNGCATALQYAAMYGHLGVAMLLVENGAHINAPGAKHNGRTALQDAAENEILDIVHLLPKRNDDEPELLAERRHDATEFVRMGGDTGCLGISLTDRATINLLVNLQSRTYRCPNADLWLGDTSVSGRRSTYAHCSGRSAIPGDTPPIGTTCLDNTVFWANIDTTEIANRGSRYCGKYACITVTVYDSYDDGFGSGPQYWIDCAENLRPPEDISKFYRTMPEVTVKTSVESASSTTELSTGTTAEVSLPSSTTSEIASETAPRNSAESSSHATISEGSTTATETPKPKGGSSLSGGAIAGIVIGSFLGGILFTSIIILRRSRSSVAR